VNYLEQVVAAEIAQHMRERELPVQIRVTAQDHSVIVTATVLRGHDRPALVRTLTDGEIARHDTIVSSWCMRTAKRLERLIGQ
jgi:hypothetical protein